MDQLFDVDLQLRRCMFACFQSLLREAQSNANPSFYEEVILQLAFAVSWAFGVRRNENECREWLVESEKHEPDLEYQLNFN